MMVKTGFVCLRAVVQSANAGNSFGGIDMSSVTVELELELPQDWKRFQMPPALKARLNQSLAARLQRLQTRCQVTF